MANKPFSQYYAEALSALPASPSQEPAPAKKPVFKKTTKQDTASKPFNFLDWGIDILSRPLYAVTEGVDSFLEAVDEAPAIRKKAESGDVLGALGDVAGSVGRQVTSGIRGLTSTHEDDKRLSHQLIEKGTDVVGPQLDPSYEDVQDNVNPIAKGVLGFVGDVALDPLTWVPGAAVAKGLNVAGRGVKAATAAAKGAKEAVVANRVPVPEARAAEEAEDIARQVDMPEPVAPTERPALDKGMRAFDNDKAPGLPDVPELPRPKEIDTINPATLDPDPVTTLPKAKDAPDPQLAAQTSFNAGVRASKQADGGAIGADGFGDPAAFEAGREYGATVTTKRVPAAGRKQAFAEWFAAQSAAAAPDVVNVAEEAAAPIVSSPKDFGYPDPTELSDLLRGEYEAPRVTDAGKLLSVPATGRQVLKELDADPKMKELLDVELEAGGDVFKVRDWVTGFFNDEVEFDDVVTTLNDGIESLRAAGKLDAGPATARESVDELVDEGVLPKADEPRPERVGAAEELLSRIGDRTAEGPTYGEYVLGMAKDPKTAQMTAITVERGDLLWKDVPKFLKAGNPETELYKQVSAAVTKKWKGRVTREKAKTKKWNSVPTIERFSQIVLDDDGRALADLALGSALTSRLASVKDPGKFDALMAEIGDVVSRITNLSEISKDSIKFDATRQALAHLGVTEEMIDVAAVSPSSHVTEAVGAAEKAADLSKPKPVTDARQAVIDATAAPASGATLAQRADRLTPEQQDAARIITREIGRDVFGIGLAKGEKRPFTTKAGAKRTHKEYGKGYAVWEGRINGPTQHNLSKGIFNSIRDTLVAFRNSKANLLNAGREYATKAKELYMKRAKVMHDLMDREGIALHLGIREDDVMLSDWQLRAVLDSTNPEATTMLLYNLQTGVPTTNLYAAVSAMLRGADDAELIKILQDNTPTFQNGQKYLNPMAGEGNRYYGHRIFQNGKVPPAPGGSKWVRNPKHPNGYFLQLSSEGLTRQALGLLRGAKPKLEELAMANSNARFARIDVESAELSAAERAWLEEIVTDPSKMGVAIRATAQPEKTVQDMARDAGATQEAVTMASMNAELDIPVVDKISAEGAARNADKQVSTGDPQAGKAGAQATQNKLIELVEDEAAADKLLAAQRANELDPEDLRQAGVNDEIAEISGDTAAQIDISIQHAVNPNASGLQQRLGRAFKANYDHERISRFRHSAEVASAWRRHEFIDQIGKLVAKHGGVVKGAQSTKNSLILKQAWNSIRAGASSPDPAVAAAITDLETIFGTMFDVTKQESVLGNVFFRNPVSVDHVNGELLAVDLKLANGEPVMFDIAAAQAKADLDGTDVMTEMVEQWRTWDIEDPAEAMLKLFTAAERVSTKAVIGQNFNRFAAKEGLFSATPQAGFAQPMASGKSIFISMLDQSGYYDASILKELSNLEAFMSASRSFQGGPGKFVHQFFDPMQQSWKYGMTVVRPGHHVRNLVGDASMTYLAEGMRFVTKSNHDAIKVLSAMHNKYDGYDFNKAMEGLGFREVPGSTDVLMSGKYGTVTIGDVFTAFYERGLMNSYRHSEDVLDAGQGSFSTLMNRISLRGGKVEEVAGSVSQARDHYARMQHFLQYIYKAQKDGGRGKSLDDLFDNAAHQVKKYHPDGSMLTPFEAKYMRRIIPFYSWLRGAIPAMVEAVVLKPSRATIFPKASLNLAVAMGVNPDSLTNPFPEDQLFPSFLTDQAFGPQFGSARGGYFGFSPGISTVDVANQFLAGKPIEGTLRGIAGSTSPLFRIPAELLSGGSWGTGARINDASDYIDSNLPGINYISNITGYSVTGSIVGGDLDPQLQVDRGNKTDVDKMLSLTNWLTGASVQNMSRPNYINYAEIEKRNAAAESGEEARNAF